MKFALLMGGVLGGLAVIFGAFGAHGLSHHPESLQSAFRTGVEYQWYHTFLLLVIGTLWATLIRFDAEPAGDADQRIYHWLRVSSWLTISGTLLFSGSLYGLALLSWSWLGPVTPMGGLLLILAWMSFFKSLWHWPSRTMAP